LADLAARSGIGSGQAWAWPLIVDGLIVVATVAVVALAGQRTAWYPWTLLIGAAMVSVAANAIHAIVAADADVPPLLAASVAAAPPVVLLAITHLTVILTRTTETTEATTAGPTVSFDAATPVPAAAEQAGVPLIAEQGVEALGVRGRRELAAELRDRGWSYKAIARHLGVHPSTVGRWFASRTNPLRLTLLPKARRRPDEHRTRPASPRAAAAAGRVCGIDPACCGICRGQRNTRRGTRSRDRPQARPGREGRGRSEEGCGVGAGQ